MSDGTVILPAYIDEAGPRGLVRDLKPERLSGNETRAGFGGSLVFSLRPQASCLRVLYHRRSKAATTAISATIRQSSRVGATIGVAGTRSRRRNDR
jgi:hypothetical protein